MLIALEGLDNSDKTTLADMLHNYFLDQGRTIIISKELTTDVGVLIKNMINSNNISPITKAFLFAADRQIRIENIVSKKEQAEIIIMDRYLYSAVAYRESENLDGNWIKELNKNVIPSDYSFYIDITPEESIKRNTCAKFNIRYSKETLQKVRESYLREVGNGNLILLNGMQTTKKIFDELILYFG